MEEVAYALLLYMCIYTGSYDYVHVTHYNVSDCYSNSVFSFSHSLRSDKIIPGDSSYSVVQDKVTLILRKTSGTKWRTLEALGQETPSDKASLPATTAPSGCELPRGGETQPHLEDDRQDSKARMFSGLTATESSPMRAAPAEPGVIVSDEGRPLAEPRVSEPTSGREGLASPSHEMEEEPRSKHCDAKLPDCLNGSKLSSNPPPSSALAESGMSVSELLAIQGEGIGGRERREEEEGAVAIGDVWKQGGEQAGRWDQPASVLPGVREVGEEARRGRKRGIEEEEEGEEVEERENTPYHTPPSSPPPAPPPNPPSVVSPPLSSVSQTSQPSGNSAHHPKTARDQRSTSGPSKSGGGYTTYTNPIYQSPGPAAKAGKPHSSAWHMRPSEIESSNPSYKYRQLRLPSLTGLLNTGNTCFMNSTLQCLSNTQEVRDYFINGRYLADINRDNPLGFRGELAKCFSQIIRKLWSGEYDYFSPKKLKTFISERSGHFSGNYPHDSHEFMSYLIDGLHEDLNRIRSKPVTASVESDGRPDSEVAEEAWQVYRQRNDSFFVDLFQGQFKSTLVCPACSKVGGCQGCVCHSQYSEPS